ncbi:hypothetical protein Q3G72_003551 [Acer saccharum]|nr:hypothetical protein Q3G72_003551 [Acer saccharum]
MQLRTNGGNATEATPSRPALETEEAYNAEAQNDYESNGVQRSSTYFIGGEECSDLLEQNQLGQRNRDQSREKIVIKGQELKLLRAVTPQNSISSKRSPHDQRRTPSMTLRMSLILMKR